MFPFNLLQYQWFVKYTVLAYTEAALLVWQHVGLFIATSTSLINWIVLSDLKHIFIYIFQFLVIQWSTYALILMYLLPHTGIDRCHSIVRLQQAQSQVSILHVYCALLVWIVNWSTQYNMTSLKDRTTRMSVHLFQSLDFMLHFTLSGPGVVLRQPLALSWMLHLQLKALQILQLPAEVIDQLQRKGLNQIVLLNILHLLSLLSVVSHLLHGLFFLLKLMAVMPELVHYLPV